MSVTATQAKDQLASLLDRTRLTGERIVIEKHGKPAGVLVSINDLIRLERLDVLEHAALARPLSDSVKEFIDPFEPAADWVTTTATDIGSSSVETG